MQAIKVTKRSRVSWFHMICDSWLYLCLCQQSNIFNALFRTAALAQWQPVVCHCPNWLTHCPLFKVPGCYRQCIWDKQHYLSWTHASSQLEGWSAAGFVCLEWLKEHSFLNSNEHVSMYVPLRVSAYSTNTLDQTHWSLVFPLKHNVYCCGLASTQPCFRDI